CGKIINICSVQSELGRSTIAAYTASKGGLKMLTRAMAVDWARYNIQINAIGPGYFITEMTRPLVEDHEFDSWLRKRTPAGRWGEPAELVGALILFASAASAFINGQILYVDGGITAAI
ncbi:MAG: SDR family oxidoreductase, partial [Spirochaetaceae bacterium]|nr:SDR family oxidoreductase [Spirochaetaceae bacterium]